MADLPFITVNQAPQPPSMNGTGIGQNPADKIDAKSGNRSISQTIFPPDLGKYRFVIIEATVDGGFTGSDYKIQAQQKLSFDRMYVLPIPFGITETHTTNYDQNFNFMSLGADAVSSIMNSAKNTLPGTNSVGATFVGNAIGAIGSAIAGGVGAATGLALNQFKMVTMKSPSFNQHKFAWKFSPKSERESETVRAMIYDLKTGMLPGLLYNRFVLTFPKVYLMYFAPNMQFLYKFKPCVLQNIQIDYQGNNPAPAFFENGGGITMDDFGSGPPVYRPGDTGDQSVSMAASLNAPESIVIHTTWLELEVWTQEDFKGKGQTNNPFDGYSWYKGA